MSAGFIACSCRRCLAICRSTIRGARAVCGAKKKIKLANPKWRHLSLVNLTVEFLYFGRAAPPWPPRFGKLFPVEPPWLSAQAGELVSRTQSSKAAADLVPADNAKSQRRAPTRGAREDGA